VIRDMLLQRSVNCLSMNFLSHCKFMITHWRLQCTKGAMR